MLSYHRISLIFIHSTTPSRCCCFLTHEIPSTLQPSYCCNMLFDISKVYSKNNLNSLEKFCEEFLHRSLLSFMRLFQVGRNIDGSFMREVNEHGNCWRK